MTRSEDDTTEPDRGAGGVVDLRQPFVIYEEQRERRVLVSGALSRSDARRKAADLYDLDDPPWESDGVEDRTDTRGGLVVVVAPSRP